jgi:hypothetical protein
MGCENQGLSLHSQEYTFVLLFMGEILGIILIQYVVGFLVI